MRSKRSRRALLMGSALAALPSLCAAQNFTWTTPTNASFSVGPWNPTVPSWGGGTSVGLVFLNNTGAPYTATNDLGAPFALNALTFNASDGRSIILNNAPGNEFSFLINGATLPTINGIFSATATLAGRTNIGTTTTVSGISTLNVNGTMTGPGAFTFTGANQFVAISGANSNSGTTTINSGTISVANNFAFGSGSLIIAGGTLRNPNPGSTLPNIVTLNNRVTLSGPLTYNAPALADLALAGSIGGTGSIVVSGAGSLRLTNISNGFTGGVTLNSGTTSFNAHLIYSGNQGIGTGSADFQGSGTGELIFNGLSSATIPLVNVGSTSTAILAAGGDMSTLNVGSLSGAGTIVLGEFSNGGTVNLVGTSNTNTGPMSFLAGVTRFASASFLGGASSLRFAGGTVLPTGSWNNTKSTILSDYTAITTPLNTVSTFSTGVSLDPTAINDALMKNGAGTLNLQGTSTARFIINSGTINVTADTNLIRYAGSGPALTINGPAIFFDLSHVATGNLPTGKAITMAGGQLHLAGPETMGTLSLAANTTNSIDADGTITFARLSQPGSAGTIYTGWGTFGSNNFVRYTTAPSGSLLLGGGGAAGTPTISVLAGASIQELDPVYPYALFENFGTYDAVNGVRSLTPSEYVTTITSGTSTLNNASPNTTVTLTSPTTINSLSGGTITGNTTLTINSGLLLNANVNVATLSLAHAAIFYDTGAISSVIKGTSLQLNGLLTLSGANQYTGDTIIAHGELTDGASEVIPDTSIVYVNDDGYGTPAYWDLHGHTETVAGISQQGVVDSGGLTYGNILLGGGTLIIGAGNVSSSFAGSIGETGHVVKIGTGTLELSGRGNAFPDSLEIRQGMVRVKAKPVASSPTGNPSDFAGSVPATISGNSVLAYINIQLASAPGNSAELRLGRGVTDLSRPISVGTPNGAGTCILSTDIDPNHGTPTAAGPSITSPITITNSSLQLSLSSGTLGGVISGSGSITVNNNPVAGEDPLPIVTINGNSSSYSGTTSVINGSLYVLGSVAGGSVGALGNATSPINLGSSATTGYAELSYLDSSGSFQRNINVTPGQPGATLALTTRTDIADKFAGSIALGATALRVFGAPKPATGNVGAILLDGQITGSGSLLIGGGQTRSTVWLDSATSNFGGGVTLTDGTLGVGTSSSSGAFTSGPLGIGSFVIADATLPPTIHLPSRDVTLANPLTVNSDFHVTGSFGLTFTGPATFSGERVITANNSVTFAGAVTTSGFLDKDGPGMLSINTSNTFSSGISVFAGTVQFGASQTLGTLNIGGSARANVTSGGNKLLRTNALNIGGGGILDLTDEDAIIDYTGTSPLPRLAQLLTSGYNAGSWNGMGITSSSAQAVAALVSNTHKTAVGFAEASTLGISSFGGQSVDGSAILMRYTFMGDANLDGLVNALDFNAVASNFGGTNRTWADGDFTYNGQVNTLDFNWIAVNFNQPPLPSSALGSLIPEPSCLILPIVLLLGGRVRRRI